MNKLIIIVCLLVAVSTYAQTITTIAGTGTAGISGDGGAATSAKIAAPFALTFDKAGNLYFSEATAQRIRKINTLGNITAIAGAGIGYNGDNIPATSAYLYYPLGLAVDRSGNLYIADAGNNRIRKIDIGTGIITTVAGNGEGGFSGDDGPATAAMINYPNDVCFDWLGNMYISDQYNFRVRKVDTSGIITTYAGNGSPIFSGEGGPATAAGIYSSVGLCTNARGDLFISGSKYTFRILKVNTSGILTTIAGDGVGYSTGDGAPAVEARVIPEKLAIDMKGNLYVSSVYHSGVRMIDSYGIIHTVAGDTTRGYYGDNGPATSAKLYNPVGLGFDSCGNLYISDKLNHRIRKVGFNPTCAPVGVNTVTKEHNLSVYPNPIQDELYIDGLSTIANYRILSVAGASLLQGALSVGANTVALSSLPSGLYLFELTTDGVRTIQKVVKQ